MKFSTSQLKRYCLGVPDNNRALRDLFDDVGLEVKNISETDGIDKILTLELLANRGDHYCYLGVAREIAARTKVPLILPKFAPFKFAAHLDNVRIDSKLCFGYSITHLSIDQQRKKELADSGMVILNTMDSLTGNNLVDITNLVNFEIGQPLHAFDKAKIEGTIVVRESTQGETAQPLFSERILELPVGTLVIADQVKILAIAGVIGCETSKVDDFTKEVFLESGIFDPVSVRKTSKALSIHTHASARYQRGGDIELAEKGAQLAVKYLQELGIIKEIKGYFFENTQVLKERVIAIDKEDLEDFLGRRFSEEIIVEILTAYNFEHTGNLNFKVPMSRIWDVKNDIDLYEEIARCLGYNAFDAVLPTTSLGGQPSKLHRIINNVNNTLVNAGFYEVFTDSFYSKRLISKFNIEATNPLSKHVETINSVDSNYTLLKNNCFAQALKAIAYNNRYKEKDIKLFEWTKTFHLDPTAKNGTCKEQDMLWGCVTNEVNPTSWKNEANWKADVFFLKGLIEEIAFENNLPVTFKTVEETTSKFSFFHPYRQFNIYSKDVKVGHIGEFHPAIIKNFKIKGLRPCYFELKRNCLLEEYTLKPINLPPSIPDIKRALSLEIPPSFNLKNILNYIENNAPQYFKSICIKEQYIPKNEPFIVYSFELNFDAEKHLSADDINVFLNQLARDIPQKFENENIKLR